MDIYKHPTFDMACEQFDLVGSCLASVVLARWKAERRGMEDFASP